MSWRTWTNSGYGFYTQDITENNLYKFLKNHPTDDKLLTEILADIEEKLEENNLDLDILDIDEDFRDRTDSYSIAEIIGCIIRKETGINIGYSGCDDYGDEALLYSPRYPWEMEENDHNLTQDNIAKTLNPYAKELGVEGCQYIDLTYSG